MNRRLNRAGIATALLGLTLALGNLSLAQEDTNYPRGDGKLRIFNDRSNKFLEVSFRKGDRILPEALQQINAFLRSGDNLQATSIDPRLLDLIDHLQDHFKADTIEIISGYGRKEFNVRSIKNSHTASQASLHTEGKALDIHIDEVREETLNDYLFGAMLDGGVGYYGPLDYVHIDVGPQHRWGEAMTTEGTLIGVLQPNAPIQLTSDKNDYLPGDTLHFTWSGSPEDLRQVSGVQLEHFFRGKWIACPALDKPSKLSSLPASSLRCSPTEPNTIYGKFRWIFQVGSESSPYSSNEFYLKKE